MKTPSWYQTEIMEATRCFPTQARYCEAWMRLEFGTLDHLSHSRFTSEAKVALECVLASTEEQNERLAQSYGLGKEKVQ